MRTTLIWLLLLVTQACTEGPQEVAGLRVDAPQRLIFRPEVAQAVVDQQPANARHHIRSVVAFSGGGQGDLTDILVLKTQYYPWAQFDIDDAASGAIAGVKRYPGVKNVRQSVSRSRVADKEARQVSLEGNGDKGKFGIEALIVYDQATSTAWIIQCSIGRRGSRNLDEGRAGAKKFLSTVGFVK